MMKGGHGPTSDRAHIAHSLTDNYYLICRAHNAHSLSDNYFVGP